VPLSQAQPIWFDLVFANEWVRVFEASYRWNGSGRVHTLTNVGSTRVEIVEIEWK
jgi:hypothetical protein